MHSETETMDADVMQQMRDRVDSGHDPLTGDPMQTSGKVVWSYDLGRTVDAENRRPVDLDDAGNWYYVDR